MLTRIQIGKVATPQVWELTTWLVASVFVIYLFGVSPVFNEGTANAFASLKQLKRSFHLPDLGLFPFLAALFFLWHGRSKLKHRAVDSEPSLAGLGIVALGAFIFVVSARIQSPYLAMLSVPLLWVGLGWSISGWRIARLLCFPALLFLFAIPIPGFLRVYTALPTLNASVSHAVISLLGVDATLIGSRIASADPSLWQFDLMEGCDAGRRFWPGGKIFIALIVGKLMLHRVWQQITLAVLAVPTSFAIGVGHTSIILLTAERGSTNLALYLAFNDYIRFALVVTWFACLITLAWWMRRYRPTRKIG